MSQSFEFEVSYGGRKFATAEAGAQALARDLDRMGLEVVPIMQQEMRRFLVEVANAMGRRHSTPWSPGRRLPAGDSAGKLASRSGRAVNELRRSARAVRRGPDVEGRIGGPFYLETHEEGRTIRPRRAKFLAVPLPAALDSRGVPKRRGPRAWRNTAVIRSRKGNLLIVQRQGGRVIPLYVLLKEVEIPERLGLRSTIERGQPTFQRKVLERVARRMAEVTRGA